MSNPHPLNQAVIAQALHDLRNGQLRRAKSMGFEDADLDALKHPAMASVLANARVSSVLCDSQSGCRNACCTNGTMFKRKSMSLIAC